jgi:hypothetical protein
MRKALTALLCAALAAAVTMPLAARGVNAVTVDPLAGVGNHHQRLSNSDCTADFWLTESPVQSVGSTSEPVVTSLTMTAGLTCAAGVGYLLGSVSISGATPPVSCSGGFANFSGNSASGSCTLTKPAPGPYIAQAHVYAGLGGFDDFTWSFDELVLPGTVVPSTPSPIGNQYNTTELAPCTMTSSIVEGPSQQTTGNLAQPWTLTATAHMACSIFGFASVTFVSPLGDTCTQTTPSSSGPSFTASCTLPSQPGVYVAAFHYNNLPQAGILDQDVPDVGPVDLQPADTVVTLDTVVV